MVNEDVEKENAELYLDNSLTVKSKINETKVRITNKLNSKIKQFKLSGIEYDSPSQNIISQINSWQYNVGQASNRTVSEINEEMNFAMNNLDMKEEEIIAIEENEFKREIKTKVIAIRAKQEMTALKKETDEINNEKINIIEKMFGKQKEKENRLAKVKEKMNLLNDFSNNTKAIGLSHNVTYSAEDVLAEIETTMHNENLSSQDKNELEKYKNAIYNMYSVDEEKVKLIVNQKPNNLLEDIRTETFAEKNENAETSFEKIIKNISSKLGMIELNELEKYGLSRDTEARR